MTDRGRRAEVEAAQLHDAAEKALEEVKQGATTTMQEMTARHAKELKAEKKWVASVPRLHASWGTRTSTTHVCIFSSGLRGRRSTKYLRVPSPSQRLIGLSVKRTLSLRAQFLGAFKEVPDQQGKSFGKQSHAHNRPLVMLPAPCFTDLEHFGTGGSLKKQT